MADMRFQSVLYKGDPEDEDARYEWALKHQREYSKEELFYDWDPFHGVLETYDYDNDTGVMTIRRTQDAATLLSDNAEWRAGEQNWKKKEDQWVRFASIPTLVVEHWIQAFGINVLEAKTDRNGVPNDHMLGVLKLLRDPDWKWLKTTEMDMGDGKQWGNYRLGHVPGNGLIWPGDGL